jgi:hypothetical protein
MDEDEVIRLSDEALRTWRGGYAARELVDECEALLDGRYVEHLLRKGAHVPVWTWTNLIAHGSEKALRHAIVASRRRGLCLWAAARSYAADETLRQAPRFGGLQGLQSSVLVPLELKLAANPLVETWLPNEWLTSVYTAMQGHASPVD